jgi:hypothetical protein
LSRLVSTFLGAIRASHASNEDWYAAVFFIAGVHQAVLVVEPQDVGFVFVGPK